MDECEQFDGGYLKGAGLAEENGYESVDGTLLPMRWVQVRGSLGSS